MYLDKDYLPFTASLTSQQYSFGESWCNPYRHKSLYKTTEVSVTAATGSQYSRSLMTRFEAKALLKLQDYGLNYILMCAIKAKSER
jgi:hypothetical protein